jgi:predicted RNA methylase
MLALAGVGSEDIVADLGAGDGRIVLAAASTHRARAVGYEIDPDLVAEARGAIDRAGLRHLAEIRDQDLLSADLSQATVFTLYLPTGANVRLRPRILEHARRGARIVSHEFGMGMWSPKQVERMRDTSGVPRTLYLWQI